MPAGLRGAAVGVQGLLEEGVGRPVAPLENLQTHDCVCMITCDLARQLATQMLSLAFENEAVHTAPLGKANNQYHSCSSCCIVILYLPCILQRELRVTPICCCNHGK